MCDDFSVVDRYDDRRYQRRAAQDTKEHSHACYKRGNEQTERQHWDKPRPH